MDHEKATDDSKRNACSSVQNGLDNVPAVAPEDGCSTKSPTVSERPPKPPRSGSHSRSISPRRTTPKTRTNTHSPVASPTTPTTPPSPHYANPRGGDVTSSTSSPLLLSGNSSPYSPQGNKYAVTDTVSEEAVPLHKRPPVHPTDQQRLRQRQTRFLEDLQLLVPDLAAARQSSAKPSVRTTLNKTIDYFKQLESEHKERQCESDMLRKEMDDLHEQIALMQTMLPIQSYEDDAEVATASAHISSPPGTHISPHMEAKFNEYVRTNTLLSWRFSIFSNFIRPLFNAYNQAVNSSSDTESFRQSVLKWLEEKCSLIALRPIMFKILRQVRAETSPLTEPDNVPTELIRICKDLGASHT